MFAKLFRRKKVNTVRDNFEVISKRISHGQEVVYNAVKELERPVNGRMVSTYLKWDSASVTPRLAELTRKGRIEVVYRKKGLDYKWRNFYRVAL